MDTTGNSTTPSGSGEGVGLWRAGGDSEGQVMGKTRETVSLQLRVNNIQYDKLLGSSSVLAAFKTSIKSAVATSAGTGVLASDVALQLSPGSVIVTAIISPPTEVDATSVSNTLSTAGTVMASQIASTIRQVAGIEDVSTGAIGVRIAKAAALVSFTPAPEDPTAPAPEQKSEDHQLVLIAAASGAGALILLLMCLSAFLCCGLRVAKKRTPEGNQFHARTPATTAVMGSPMKEGKENVDTVPGSMYATPGSGDVIAVGYPINEKV
jgi:hypothetical protein